MPSLNLRNPLRRDPNRPTLKQRAAAIKATAGRVMRRRAVEVAPAAPGADPRLTAMVAELLEARRTLNDPSVPDGPEADALGEREADLCIAVHRFSARSIHDMAAKLPLLREEAEDVARRWDGRRVPFDASLPGAAWAGLLRDIAHLAGIASPVQVKPDPIFAAIEANREAEAQMDAFGREEDARSCASARAKREKALAAAQTGSWKTAFKTRPTTQAGMQALVDWIRWQLGRHGEPLDGDGTVWADACLSLLAVVESISNASGPVLAVPPAPNPVHASDLSNCSVRELARLYDTFTERWHSASVGMGAPFAWDGDDYSPSGRILDAECDRLARIMDAIEAETAARRTANEDERDERLGLLVRHELLGNSRLHPGALLSEVIATWGA